jgi:hypothetical protein
MKKTRSKKSRDTVPLSSYNKVVHCEVLHFFLRWVAYRMGSDEVIDKIDKKFHSANQRETD